MLESDHAIRDSQTTHTITQYVASPGNHTLSLEPYEIRDRACNKLVDSDPDPNEPYHVVGESILACQVGD